RIAGLQGLERVADRLGRRVCGAIGCDICVPPRRKQLWINQLRAVERNENHLQTAAVRADKTRRDNPVFAEFPFDEGVPLLDITVLVILRKTARSSIESRIVYIRTYRIQNRVNGHAIEWSNHHPCRRCSVRIAAGRRRERACSVESWSVVEARI